MKDKKPPRKAGKSSLPATVPPVGPTPAPVKAASKKAPLKTAVAASDDAPPPPMTVQAPPAAAKREKAVQNAVDAVLHPPTVPLAVKAAKPARAPARPKNVVPTERIGNPRPAAAVAPEPETMPASAVVAAPSEPMSAPQPPVAAAQAKAEAPQASPAPSPPVDAAPFAARQAEPRPPMAPVASRPDFETMARNMGLLFEEGSRAAAAFFTRRDDQAGRPPAAETYAGLFQTFGQVAEFWFSDPARLVEAQAAISAPMIELWADTLRRFSGEPLTVAPEPAKGDKRFADPEWRQNPFFDFVRRAYLIGSQWAFDLVERAESLDPTTRDKARFYMRQVASALSPTNFVLTNPELLRETLRENGANLVRGMSMLTEDVNAGRGELRIRQTDVSKFEIGKNIAVTPGKVVFRNDLLELLQYSPTTETVLKRPLLVVPPWINKFYILDLNPDKSFVRWAVDQGLTVFVVSWVNPDARHAEKGWGAYVREGLLAALDAVSAATGETDIAALGYCVGGTLLATTLALMAAHGDKRVSSLTLLTAQVDFTHAGDLKVFADEGQIRFMEAQMTETGYLSGAMMAQAFNMLRPDDLIWSFVVNNYLKGKEPLPFDLLAWNADATRMTAANHSFYLRNCYLENKLAAGRMVIDGEAVDLGRIAIPLYNLATREDHIAPARSVFDGSRFFGGPVRFVMAGSGHIAGVVSPPAKAKYGFRTGPDPRGEFDDWIAASTHQAGSWWPNWLEWLRAQAPATVPARQPGAGALPALGDAPGTYVLVKD